jgi:ferredoxin
MAAKVLRKIIEIDEEKCTGCGECINSCAEGALALVGGKAKLVKEKYCDGLASCLRECPTGALKIVEREAEDFDEAETNLHIKELKQKTSEVPCTCADAAVRKLEKPISKLNSTEEADQVSNLTHWPVQLTLVPAGAKFLHQADVVLVADCVPFAYPNLHRDFLKDHAVLVACPKLDDAKAHTAKLTQIIQQTNLKSLTVVRMEVPCCSGLTNIARQATASKGLTTPLKEVVISFQGNIKSTI